MAQTPYINFFATEDAATRRMITKNRAARDGSIFCLVEGPEDNYAVVDLNTAVELGLPYRWEL